MTTMVYTPGLDIRNLDSLPSGTGCSYLLCIKSHEQGVLIAKAWKRKRPIKLKESEVLVEFPLYVKVKDRVHLID